MCVLDGCGSSSLATGPSTENTRIHLLGFQVSYATIVVNSKFATHVYGLMYKLRLRRFLGYDVTSTTFYSVDKQRHVHRHHIQRHAHEQQ